MKKGFTLIEMVIILAIFGILLVVGTDFLIQTIKSSNRSAMENEVRQNANQIMQDIGAEARKADGNVGFTFVGGAGNLQMSTVNANPSRLVAYSVDVFGVLTKTITLGGTALPATILNSNSTAVLNCTGCPGSSCTPGLVVSQATLADPLSVSLTIQNNSTYTRSDFCAKVSLSDIIMARLY